MIYNFFSSKTLFKSLSNFELLKLRLKLLWQEITSIEIINATAQLY